MALLAIQIGVQPMLIKECIEKKVNTVFYSAYDTQDRHTPVRHCLMNMRFHYQPPGLKLSHCIHLYIFFDHELKDTIQHCVDICRCTVHGCKINNKSQVILHSIVVGQELMKVVIAFIMMQLEFKGRAHELMLQVKPLESITLGAIPAIIYAVQNLLCQMGYQVCVCVCVCMSLCLCRTLSLCIYAQTRTHTPRTSEPQKSVFQSAQPDQDSVDSWVIKFTNIYTYLSI